MITYARIASTVLIFMLCFNNPLRGDGLFSGTPSGDPFSAQDSSGGVVISHGFTVGDTDLFVTDLGVWDQFQDGLNFSYSVGIFDLGGLIFSTDIQSGTTSELIGEFRYESINTVVLESANEYVLAAFYSQNTDDIYVRDSLSNVVTSGNLADESPLPVEELASLKTTWYSSLPMTTTFGWDQTFNSPQCLSLAHFRWPLFVCCRF